MKHRWIILAGLILAACSTPDMTERVGEVTGPPPADEEITIPAATSVPDPVGEGEMTSNESDVVLEGDTRGEVLRAITLGWNTDWTRRTIEYDEVLSGGPPRDGIPSIDDPVFISQDKVDWLAEAEPVIALEIDGDARAYPIQVITWHEIVNDEVGGQPVVVTFCPLCNSAIVFNREVDGAVYEFGVSGLLRNSDLIMYDRTTESLWQQFTGEGIVGVHAGDQLEIIPSGLLSYGEFQQAYPGGQVLSRETGISRQYGVNPYVDYDSSSRPFLFTGAVDPRLAAMERVVGLNFGDQQIAYPYTSLADTPVVQEDLGGQPYVIFYAFGTNSALDAALIAEARDVGATGVFNPVVEDEMLTFEIQDGAFVDAETGSQWNLSGQAVDGPLAGTQLERLVATDHFWFSWAAFYPETEVYTP